MTVLDVAIISSLPDEPSRFQHVCKHLYCSRERWEFVVPELPSRPKCRAQEAGCRTIELRRAGYHDACEPCRIHVLADHARFYEPAYREALSTAIAAGRWGAIPRHPRQSELFVGDNGVMVAVNKLRRTDKRQVGTAYRVVPRGLSLRDHSPEAFLRAAERKLRDKIAGGR